MGAQRVERRLAAVVAADVVGYSRIMGRDEAGTLARLKAHRVEFIEPLVAEHGGRIVKLLGDCVLCEFASTVDAVACAVKVQKGMAEREAATPEDARIRFRVGIHLGDVIVEDGDIYGDGVNIAARIEALAAPGGICVSGDIFRQARGKLEIAFEDLGEQTLKNIAEPLRVYRARFDVAGAKPAADPADRQKVSIAILPLTNMSGDPEQEYFSDGITEDLITDLSKIPALFVIARNSTFAYKGRAVGIAQVGRELGVRFVVEGSVRRAGNRVRVTAQLIEAETGGHLWAERFDRELTDIFAVQDEVTRDIVAALRLRLIRAKPRPATARGTENLEAYDLLLRGRELHYRYTPEGVAEAEALFRRALALAPDYALAHALLGACHLARWNQGWSRSPEDSLDPALDCALKAVALDESLPQAHAFLSHAYVWKRRHEAAVAQAERAVALDPNYADGYGLYAVALAWAGRPTEAVAAIEQAMRLNPLYPVWYPFFLGMVQFNRRQYAEAAGTLRRAIARNPEFLPSHLFNAATLAALGRVDDARRATGEIARLNPAISVSHLRDLMPYKEEAMLEHYLDAMRQAGLPE